MALLHQRQPRQCAALQKSSVGALTPEIIGNRQSVFIRGVVVGIDLK
jgi:hypothetical protein